MCYIQNNGHELFYNFFPRETLTSIKEVVTGVLHITIILGDRMEKVMH